MRFVPPVAALADGAGALRRRTSRRTPVRWTRSSARSTDLGATIDNDGGRRAAVHPDRSAATCPAASSPGRLVLVAVRQRAAAGRCAASPAASRSVHDGDAIPSLAAHRHDRRHAPRARRRGRRQPSRTAGSWRPATDRAAATSQIEPDLSNAAPFLAAAAVTGGTVTVPHWPSTTQQPGDQLRDILRRFGAEVTLATPGPDASPGTDELHGVDLDLHEASELTPVVAALAALADDTSHLRASPTSAATRPTVSPPSRRSWTRWVPGSTRPTTG